ncbi:MAG TPA: hypothetical protein VNC16_08370 [Solirubrobacterales bacterium]|nr:hypothetical protein [Solirubrobacterales bacterium]
MAERLLQSNRGPSLREGLIAAALIALLGVLAYGGFVTDGGFYSDDWAHVADYEFAESPRYVHSFEQQREFLGGRPLSAALMPLPQAVFGTNAESHLILALVIGVLASIAFFVLLRTLGMAPLHAGVIAALTLLFPWADSSRLWATGSVNSVSVAVFFVALTVAVRGFAHSRRRGTAMHALAAFLYLLSVLTYEVTAAVALLAGLLYFGRTERRVALRAWAADAAIVFAALLYSLIATTSARPVATVRGRLEDLPDFVREALLLLSSAFQPFGSMSRPAQALVLLAAALVVAALALRLRRRGESPLRETTLEGWPRWMLIGFLAAAGAYFMFLGSHLYPRDGGINNRVNVLAGFAICLLVYATIACACQLLLRSPRRAGIATLVVALVLGAGYAISLEDDQSQWRQAAEQQAAILDDLDAELLPLPDHSIVLVFGYPAQAAPGIPVFDRSWDMGGALQVRSGGAVRAAYPVHESVEVSCGRRVGVDGGEGYGSFTIDYGRLYFYDAELGPEKIDSRRSCKAILGRYKPGPLEI